MRTLKIISSISIFCVAVACNSKLSDHEISNKAKKITQVINEKNIDVFYNWQFEYRGKGEIWTKSINDRTNFTAYYFKEKDSISFMIFSRDLKGSEYPCLVEIDTSQYQSNFWFTKTENGQIEISSTKKDGTDTIIGKNYSDKDVFGENNPFNELNKLSNLKDEIGVVSIYNNQRLGDFTQFYITYEDVLTYIPDNLNLNPKYKNVWLENFKTGKTINKNWNLRHLENPKQGG